MGGCRGVHVWDCMHTHGGFMSHGKTQHGIVQQNESKTKLDFKKGYTNFFEEIIPEIFHNMEKEIVYRVHKGV